MTLEELLTKLDEWIESLNSKMAEAARMDDDPAVLLDEMAVADLTNVLKHARAVVLYANGDD